MKTSIKILTSFILFFLASSCADFSPPKPVEVKAPTSVTTSSVEEYPLFLVDLRKDHSVWANAVTSDEYKELEKVPEPIKESLERLIIEYTNSCEKNNKRASYLIRGNNSITYVEFKLAVEAFKSANVYKFKMISE